MTALIPAAELATLNSSGTVTQPNCAVFPTAIRLYQISSMDASFFISLGQVVGASRVLIETFPGPCTILGTTAAGESKVIASYSGPGVTFFAGSMRHDALLGDVWFTVGAANCGVRGAPTAWCT